MPLDWTFTFIHVTPDTRHLPEIVLIVSFRDGKLQVVSTHEKSPTFLHQMEKILNLISYLAFFPDKNFIKIQLATPNNQHAVHFLEKQFLDENKFLGVLSVSEFDVKEPFKLWGVEEMMANYVFDYFLDWIGKKDQNISQISDLDSFTPWLQSQVADFYLDWKDAKIKGKLDKKEVEISQITDRRQIENRYEHWWDLQLINEGGIPVTNALSFLNDQSFYYMDESENASQNITSMSLSALKLVIEEHGGDWNIEYLKSRLKNEMGYQYVFFNKFSIVKDNKLLTFLAIMNSGLFDLEKEIYVQVLTGWEIDLLQKFAAKLKLRPEIFSKDAILEDFDEGQDEVHKILLSCVEEVRKN